MEHNDFFGERPSVPASVALRVSGLRHRTVVCSDLAAAASAAVGVQVGSGVFEPPATGSRSMSLLSHVHTADQGRSVPEAVGVPAGAGATRATVRAGIQITGKHTRQLGNKQLTTTHINVVPRYRSGGVGGAPPRGRPD